MNMLTLLLINLLLALAWMLLWGQMDIYGMLTGFLVSYFLLGLISRTVAGQHYGSKGWKLISFALYFIRILIKANLQVAWEIITPGYRMTPRLVRYGVQGMTPLQITSLANAITLTPGTLSVDVSDDQQFLYVHCMYARNRAAAVAELDELRDRMMREIFA